MNDLERDFVGDDEVHYHARDDADHDAGNDSVYDSVYDDMPGLINYEDSSDHSHIMNLYGDFNRFNDNDYDCEEIKEELETETHGELETETHGELETETHGELETETHGELEAETHGDLETGLKNEMNEVHPEPAINREIEVSPKQTKSFCIIC
jgi:hypothetical protein